MTGSGYVGLYCVRQIMPCRGGSMAQIETNKEMKNGIIVFDGSCYSSVCNPGSAYNKRINGQERG